MNIVIYSNCAGRVLHRMFETHPDFKCKVYYLANYEKLNSNLKINNKEI